MHIPSSMLNGAVCPVTLAVAGAGVSVAAYYAHKVDKKPSVARFAAVTSLIFALQMFNYPVAQGTSGHLVGAILAVSLLGIPFAVLAMAIILAVQAVFFGDGGLNALGANILNMSLLSAGLTGFIYNRMLKASINKEISLGLTGFFSVLVAAAACSFEVALCGAISLQKVLPAMLSVHALIGLGEGLLTVLIVVLLKAYGHFWVANERRLALGASALAILSVFLSPFASSFPDGLEWVAGKLSFAKFTGLEIPVMFPNYQVAFMGHGAVATVWAGIIGVGLVSCLAFLVGKKINQHDGDKFRDAIA